MSTFTVVFILVGIILISITVYRIVVLINIRDWSLAEIKDIEYYLERKWERRVMDKEIKYDLLDYLSVSYTYEVNGTIYTGNKVTPFSKNIKIRVSYIQILFYFKDFPTIKSKEDFLLKYANPSNGKFYVYYNPHKPDESFLTKKGVISETIILIIVSYFIVTFILKYFFNIPK
ncbi:MAG: DUF3592 domain-containing protein [Brevinematales bacterium]|nr:DUF3592 domain-containing protein [Brevinematales bacterium]